MAKPLSFKMGEQVYDLEPLKLDRKKLYGWIEKVVLDSEDNECNTLSLYPDKAILIPKGGVSLGSVTDDGTWVDKSDLIYVNEDGSPASLVPSSFDGEIELNDSVPIELLLEHNIISIYSLQDTENHPEFVKAITDNQDIFTFTFNFRSGYGGDPAFVVENDGAIFILVGKKIEFEFIGLKESGVLDADETTDDEEEDEFDFSMM